MKLATAALILQATAAVASIFDTILPTERPTETKDDWECTTSPLEEYFNPPTPTGKLLTALLSYGDVLQKGCKSTLTDALGHPTCTFPAQSRWCSVTNALPTTLLSEYSSYGSVASSWWAAHSSAAVEDALDCPSEWFKP